MIQLLLWRDKRNAVKNGGAREEDDEGSVAASEDSEVVLGEDEKTVVRAESHTVK